MSTQKTSHVKILIQMLEKRGFTVEVTKTEIIATLKGGGSNEDYEKRMPISEITDALSIQKMFK